MRSIKRLQAKLAQLIENGTDQPYLYIEAVTENNHLLHWLKQQPHSTKMYWSDKCDDLEVAMIGECHRINNVNCPTRLPQAVYYGGIGFQHQTATWPHFGDSKFVLPRVELRHENNQFSFRCHLDLRTKTLDAEVAETLKTLQMIDVNLTSDQSSQVPSAIPQQESEHNTLVSRTDTPNEAAWKELVDNAIDAQCQSLFSKVVLSRQTQLHFSAPVNAWDTLLKWQRANNNCYNFAFQFSAGDCFIGCSPERLFMRRGNNLTTEALAGTIVRGGNSEQDQQLAQKLQDDPKIMRENTLVSEDILSRLQSLCKDIGVNDLSVLKLKTIQHLKQRIHAYLHDDVGDDVLLSQLHPTPAVGGYPRNEALAFILANEPYQRGWYAGAVGYISEKESEFSVAIRSALIQGNKMNIFAGAGIVKGSEASLEWQELNNKIRTILSLVDNAH